MPNKLNLAVHVVGPILAAVEQYLAFPLDQLPDAVRNTSTCPSRELSAALNEVLMVKGVGPVPRRELLRFTLSRAGRASEADDISRALDALQSAAVRWDDDAGRVVEWNRSKLALEAFERRQAGLLPRVPALVEYFSEELKERHGEAFDLAQTAARALRWLAQTLKEPPQGKSGRPETTGDLKLFAEEQKAAGKNNMQIAAAWNRAHPENPTNHEKVRSALRRLKNKRKTGRK
jgi:hypothetical protein